MITSSGPICDACKKYILLDPNMKMFVIPFLSTPFISHEHADCQNFVNKKASIATNITNAAVRGQISEDDCIDSIIELIEK